MKRRGHRELRTGLHSYLDGEASPVLAARVGRHLDECWSCSQEAEWLVLVKASLARLAAARPSELAVARLSRYARSLSDDR